MKMGSVLHFFCCEVSFLIRSNAAWNAMTVNKELWKSTDDSFVRALHVGKANTYSQ